VVRGGLDQLDQHAPGVLGVDEVDPAAGGAALRRVVEQPHAPLAQGGADGLDVRHPVGHLLDARPAAVEELRDGRLRGERRQQLHARAGRPDGHHRLAHALLGVLLGVHELHAERVAVERDRGVEVGDGDPDVVDGGEQGGGRRRVHDQTLSRPRVAAHRDRVWCWPRRTPSARPGG
jgi:hypothetical protein